MLKELTAVPSRIIAVATVLALLLASCGGGGVVAPTPSQFQLIAAASGAAKLIAAAGSADAGTAVSVAAPAVGSGIAASDGSVLLALTAVGARTLDVTYTKSGQLLTTSVAVTSLDSRVNKNLFATGAGPNDLLFANDSLYVASSLDNQVTRNGLDGAELASASFPQFASPSFIEFRSFDNTVWVSRNGDNIISGLDALTLLTGTGDHPLVNASVTAFIGPGRVQAYDFLLLVPITGLDSFGPPSDYDDQGIGMTIPLQTTQAFTFLAASRNGQEAEIIPTTSFSVLTSAGEIQFDEHFVPSATTDSRLDIVGFSAGDVNAPTLRASLNLGTVGASAIAISPDGQTAYLGNQINGNLYKVSLADLDNPVILRGKDNPIMLSETGFTYISDVEFTPDGALLLATSFNDDALYVIDPATDTLNPGPYPAPFDLKLAVDTLAGSIGVETNGDKAWVLYAIGNAVAEVDLF
jgi:DNA-binding beta-propeller fold protein YncE